MAAPSLVDLAQGQSVGFQKACAHREHYLAHMAEVELRKAQGELVDISFVQKAVCEAARSLNHLLITLSPQLAPQLAALSAPWEIERQRLNEATEISRDDFGMSLE
ncbi:hypothetical protein [Pseudomonas anatoliensis]|uniref:hypothetical protein n=1 Tax=Pseudomonas anatoliensis TaxID=2710589 RepID=UPI001E2BBD3B|nr:hypothetical protein [Pseudomonas anatoliensis]